MSGGGRPGLVQRLRYMHMIPDSHLFTPPPTHVGFCSHACSLTVARWLQLWPSWLCSRQGGKESRSKGWTLSKDFLEILSIFPLPSQWLELTCIPIPSHKEIGKVNTFSSKQYQGSIHWKQGENRPLVGKQQPLPPLLNMYYVPDSG